MAKGKKGTAKSASSKPKYGSKYVNEIMEKSIDKKVSASLGKHANMNQKWCDKMRKKVLGKLSGLSSSLFGEKTVALNEDITRLTTLIASRRAELKRTGAESITDSYKAFGEAKAQSAASTASTTPAGTPKSAKKGSASKEKERLELVQAELAEVRTKLALMHQEINVSVDEEINARALAISETVTVVQEAVTKMIHAQ